MAETAETAAAIDDALHLARRVVAILDGMREVASLPDADGLLADAPRKIVLGQMCVHAARMSNQVLDEVGRALKSVNKADA